MKHAGARTLAMLAPLLSTLREYPQLVERTPGSFYRGSKAYLHFHEDREGVFADVRLHGTEFTRLRVTTAEERSHFLSVIAQSVDE